MSRVSSMVVFGGLILTTFATPKVTQYFPQAESPVTHQSQNQEELQIFTGTIVSMSSGILFLKDTATGTLYGLDNQAVALEFVDKQVSVTGTLGKMHTIHVKNIEVQKV